MSNPQDDNAYPDQGRPDDFILREDEERKFDLEERTARFGEAIIHLAKKVPKSPENIPLISQVVRCGTSVGANYCEADDAVSRKEFRNKIGTCKKEARETKHFLRMIAASEESLRNDARLLWKEARAAPDLLRNLQPETKVMSFENWSLKIPSSFVLGIWSL